MPLCPEIAAGLPTPRPPAEIKGGDGADILDGTARLIEPDGTDVTDVYVLGARNALQTAQDHGCRYALLTENSPSCGSDGIYDGTFSGKRRPGMGVVTALLRRNDIRVYGPSRIEALIRDMAEG